VRRFTAVNVILSETNEYSLAFDTFVGGGVRIVLALVTFALKRSRNEPRNLIVCKLWLITNLKAQVMRVKSKA